MRRARAVLGLGLLSLALVAVASELQIIELRYRLADEIVPVVQPLLEPGGVLSGADRLLFVNTSPANLEQIRQAVELLDRRPRQLLVTVGQGTVAREERTEVVGRASAGSGDVQVGVNAPPRGEPGVSVELSDRSQRTDLHNTSSVRTLEGAETYITVGQLAPLTTTQVVPGRRGSREYTATEYREVSTGFYATARVHGDIVTIEVAPRQQRLGNAAHGTVVETAGIVSTITGRLGEWLPIGAVQQDGDGSASGLLLWGRRTAGSQYSAWVKVEEIP